MRSQFWVIVGYLPFIKVSVPFFIGVNHGKTKPKLSNNFWTRITGEDTASVHNRI
jgi:hypothetical protein